MKCAKIQKMSKINIESLCLECQFNVDKKCLLWAVDDAVRDLVDDAHWFIYMWSTTDLKSEWKDSSSIDLIYSMIKAVERSFNKMKLHESNINEALNKVKNNVHIKTND